MNVLPFRKRTEAVDAVQQRPASFRYRSQAATATSLSSSYDDFGHEVELTRRHDLLMAVLKVRAAEPATVSLHDIKRKIELDA
jgi:hypothetical protein